MKKLLTILTDLLTIGIFNVAFAGDKILEFEWNHDDPEGQGIAELRICESMASGVYDKANDLLITIPFTAPAQPAYTGEGSLASPDEQEVMWYFVATATEVQRNVLPIGNSAKDLRLVDRSRMSREAHVLICERLRGKFPRSTRRA